MTIQATDDRVTVKVIITVGDEAWVQTPLHDGMHPLKMPAGEIAVSAELPVSELAGRDFYAVPDGEGFRGFRLVCDPRL